MSANATNLIGPLQDRGPVVLTITNAFLVASTVFVVLRLVSRIGIVRKVTWDDHFIVLAWFLALGFSFSICWGTHVGLGRHERDVPVQDQLALRKSEYAFSVLYNPVLMATKTSILIFYLTLSRNQQIFRWTTFATLFVVNVAGLALTFLNIFQCHPVGAVFVKPQPSTAVCTDIVTLYLSSSPVNIITDLAILFLPMPILTGMRLPRKQKIILIITFSFGAFVAVVDVVRIAYLQEAFQVRLQEVGRSNKTESTNMERDDFSWYASLSFMWSAIEVHVGIICACVPALKPLASRILPSILRDLNDPHDTSHLNHPGTAGRRSKTVTLPKRSSTTASPTPIEPPAAPGEEKDMDMMDFLTTPDMAHTCTSTQTAMSTNTWLSRTQSSTFFDFVNVEKSKPMMKMTNKESCVPICFVTILFFLWGFAYGLLDILNTRFQQVIGMGHGQLLGLHAAYFVAYLIAPLTFGRWILKKWGFKACFIIGLCLYGCGTLIFWPSAVLTSFPAFLISNFIVGLGLSTLEVAANPFIALCGPPEHSETRLNLSQGVQAIGTLLSPLLAQKVMFKNVVDANALIDAQWAYLGIALFDIALALAFYYFPIPEASDKDFEEVAEKRHSVNSNRFYKLPVIYITLGLGVFCQFFYVAGQEAAAVEFLDYINLVKPHSEIGAFNYQVIGHTAFAAGRFLCAFAGLIIKPRWILLFLFGGMTIASILAMNLTGYAGIAMIVLIMFFESGVFPMIFAISLRGLGSHTKTGSVFLTAAVSGGALWPVIMSQISSHRGLRYSFCTVVAASALGALFPLYLTFVPAAKKQVDPVHRSRSPILPTDRSGLQHNHGSRVFSTVMRRKRTTSGTPTVEHMEGDKMGRT